MLLFRSKILKLDCYLLRYKKDSYAPAHKDAAPDGYIHHRLNIVISLKGVVGGIYREERSFGYGSSVMRAVHPDFSIGKIIRVYKINPSDISHEVTEVKKGTRYVLSIGWLRKRR